MVRTTLYRAALLTVILLLGIAASPQQANQTQRFPQFENDDVRVWRSIIYPNSPMAMHRHEHPRVAIPLTAGTLKTIEESGAATVHNWVSGKAYWLTSTQGTAKHADVNAGDKPLEVMMVELKTAK